MAVTFRQIGISPIGNEANIDPRLDVNVLVVLAFWAAHFVVFPDAHAILLINGHALSVVSARVRDLLVRARHLSVAAKGCGVNWQNFGRTPQDRAGPVVLSKLTKLCAGIVAVGLSGSLANNHDAVRSPLPRFKA